MRNALPGSPVEHLQPGEVFIGTGPRLVHTVLGSCVAITLYHPRRRLAAILHALLPRNERPDEGRSFRYLEDALPHLLARYDVLGVERREIQAKVFGGGDVLDTPAAAAGGGTVGRLNIEAARRLLADAGLRVTAADVGGSVARTLYFDAGTGHVYLRRLRKRSGDDADRVEG